MQSTKPKKQLSIQYSAYIDNIVETNASFDKGLMFIAYKGDNRNGTRISKESFEDAASSLGYIPVVANYSIKDDKIGGHDSVFTTNKKGNLKEYKLTDPVGLVPEKPNWFWQDIQENNGTVNTYFCCEVLLWKRQAAYEHIKEKKEIAQSMEIEVDDYDVEDGILIIKKFHFLALTLLESVNPCFESAALQVFNANSLKYSLDKMFSDFKESCQKETMQNYKEDKHLDKKRKDLIKSYNLDPESLPDECKNLSMEALTEYLDKRATKEFLLNTNVSEALNDAISVEKIETDYGTYSKYFIVDFDMDSLEVYAYDREDYKLYGFSFSVSGDAITIDFESKKRKKFTIVDFEGEDDTQEFSLMKVVEPAIHEAVEKEKATVTGEYEVKLSDLNEKLKDHEALESKVEELQEFQATTLKNEERADKTAILDKFSDKLKNSKEYEALYKEEILDTMSEKDLEARCYELIGKGVVNKEFSINLPDEKPVVHTYGKRISNETKEKETPYGNFFNDLETK